MNCTSLTSIPEIKTTLFLLDGCKWLNDLQDFEENMRALRICQAMWKRKVLGRKLERVIPIVSEIYYSPGCKGEHLAERAFLTKARVKKLIGTQ
jgi:hypothetical protein